MNNQQAKTQPKSKPNQKKLTKEEQDQLDMQETTQKFTRLQMIYLLPVLVGVGAYSFSAALGLYWSVQNLFALIQTIVQYRIMNQRMNWEATKEDFSNFFNKLIKLDFRKKDENPIMEAIEVLEGEEAKPPKKKKAKKSKKSKKKRR